VAGTSLFVYLYVQVTNRFEGQLWTFPSRVYSDRIALSRGSLVDSATVLAQLSRNGYARTDAPPATPGTYRFQGRTLDLYRRSFTGPSWSLPPGRFRVRFDRGRLAAIDDERGRTLDKIELEPELLALMFGPRQEEREFLRLVDVPRDFVHAVLAAEDSRFYDHHGVDFLAIGRASAANLKSGRIVQGGSTITQQTVKNLHLGQERTWWRKIREVLLALVLDGKYDKDRILEVYLNEVYLGQRGSVAICGVGAASRYYFGRDLRDLSLADMALLAGLIRSPGSYNPFAHPEQSVARRNLVLDAMAEAGLVAAEAAAKARAEPLRLGSGGAGFARAPYVVDLVRAQLSELYPPRAFAEEGLRIFTTIDTIVQEQGEEKLRKGLERLEKGKTLAKAVAAGKRLQGLVIVLEPGSGAVLALVGGRDYQGSQFNRAVQARRQPGSCFKPFVYLAGFEAAGEGSDRGLTPASILEDEPVEIRAGGKTWRPMNYDGEFRGPVTAREALEKSLNIPAVQAAQHVGLSEVISVAERCGVKSRLQELPSLALGAQEVTPLELATAYATLANEGTRVTPRIIREVVSGDGTLLPTERSRTLAAVSPQAAFLVTDVLRGVLLEGTAASARALGFEGDAAGKTGTTDDMRDSWFVGYTPDLLALVWVGFDDNARTGLTGATGALPIWVDFLMHVRFRWGASFHAPEGLVQRAVDPATGGLAVARCPAEREEWFLEGTEPDEPCPVHGSGIGRWLKNLLRPRDEAAPD
jgi:penicillin-binding protein 1B